MGGADGSSDAQRRRSRSPSAQRLFLCATSTLHKKLAMMIPGTTQLMAGAKRKCFQAAKDMDNIVEQTTLKQARALSRVLFAWMMDTVHLRRRAQRQLSSTVILAPRRSRLPT